MKKFLTLLLAYLFVTSAQATHLQGGEITWQCKSNGKYVFTLSVYRDCGGVTLPTTAQTLANNAGATISCAYVSTTDITPSCYTGTTSCTGASSAQGILQKYIYRSGEITLTGTPPTGGWYFSWTSCCRPNYSSNLTNPSSQGYNLRSVMYPYVPAGATTALSAGSSSNPSCFDNSPNFYQEIESAACSYYDMQISYKGFDKDLDSIHYSFANPRKGSGVGSPVTFSTGYSATSPLPSGTASTAAVLDSHTGVLSFTSALSGTFTTCISMKSYRCGQLIGEVFRDMPIYIQSCPLPSGLCSAVYTSNSPYISISSNAGPALNPVTNGSSDTVLYTIDASVGDSISLNLSASDGSVNPDCSSQDITIVGSGGSLSSASNYGNPSTCLFGGPCATLTSLNPGGNFTYSMSNSVRFDWTIDTSHIQYTAPTQCQNYKTTYRFYFTAKDDECPINKSSHIVLDVNILDTISFFPEVVQTSCAIYDSAQQQLQLNWTPNDDTSANWSCYLIERISQGTSLVSSDTVTQWSDSTFILSNFTLPQTDEIFIRSVGQYGSSPRAKFNLPVKIQNSVQTCNTAYSLGGMLYTASGVYWSKGQTSAGCDSTYKLSLQLTQSAFTLQPQNDTVAVNGSAVFMVDSLYGATYSWQMDAGVGYVTLTNAGPFQGVNTHKLTVNYVQLPNNNTYFRCVRTVLPCTSTSIPATLIVVPLSIEEEAVSISIYPNPARTHLNIDCENNDEVIGMIIYDALGRVQANYQGELPGSISLGNYISGDYRIEVKTNRGSYVRTFTVVK
jgi:hypothetical protein